VISGGYTQIPFKVRSITAPSEYISSVPPDAEKFEKNFGYGVCICVEIEYGTRISYKCRSESESSMPPNMYQGARSVRIPRNDVLAPNIAQRCVEGPAWATYSSSDVRSGRGIDDNLSR
jgi:hypothetical protein